MINGLDGLPISQQTEVAVFKMVWSLNPPRSFISGFWLREFMGSPFFFNLFAHVLPKAQNKFPYFRYYYKNIVLLTPGEHALWDNGTEEARISYALDVEEKSGGKTKVDWNKLKSLEEELKLEYKKIFPTTKGLIIGYKYDKEEIMERVGGLNRQYLEEYKRKTIKDHENAKTQMHEKDRR